MMDKKSYYHTCPLCGANLDPGEHCDCDESEHLPHDSNKSDERMIE